MRKWDYILLAILGTAAVVLYFGQIEIGIMGIEEKKKFRLINLFKGRNISPAWWTSIITAKFKIGR